MSDSSTLVHQGSTFYPAGKQAGRHAAAAVVEHYVGHGGRPRVDR
jgi:hypothetical protein